MPNRRSRLLNDGAQLFFADLHNHSLFSDGRGDPERAFGQLRDAGLDVAALTDHASVPAEIAATMGLSDYPSPRALDMARNVPKSITSDEWNRLARIADDHDSPGEFTAIRGFEWTDQWMGHINVWLGDTFTMVTTPGSLRSVRDNLRDNPGALFGYNHPGREPGRFEAFSFVPDLSERFVGLELFNRSDDYLFSGYLNEGNSAVVACLEAGWRPGVIGSSDEHGSAYGLLGKGRTGIWAFEHSRAGVREALSARRTFATREVDLHLEATLNGVRMGSSVSFDDSCELNVDLSGSTYDGTEVELQLLSSGANGLPDLVTSAPARVGQLSTVALRVPERFDWILLRVADPGRVSGASQPVGHGARGWALAYASPWWRA